LKIDAGRLVSIEEVGSSCFQVEQSFPVGFFRFVRWFDGKGSILVYFQDAEVGKL